MRLSDLAICRAKPGDKPLKLFDGGGLYLLLQPTGARYWRWKYHAAGKEKLLALGIYPDVPLALARQRREDARQLLARGVDPGEHKKAAAAARAELGANTFEVVAREWLTKRDWVDTYRIKVAAWLDNDVFPWIGSRLAAELEATDFLAVARRVEGRGAIESAHRIMQNRGQVMRYAIATGRAKRNPVADLRSAPASPPDNSFAAVTDPDELAPLLRAINGYSGTMVVMCALQMAPMVFLHPEELRQPKWAEFDLEQKTWTTPAARMKMQRPHLVSLSDQVLAMLEEIRPLTGRGRDVFPSA